MANSDDLRAIGLLSDEADPEFDRVVKLAAHLLHAEICILTVVNEPMGRQYLKAVHGLPPSQVDRGETQLPHAFCELICDTDLPVVVPDVRNDPKFSANTDIASLKVVAYLGVPIERATGVAIGALCAISLESRAWSEQETSILLTLASGVSSQIQLRLALREQLHVSGELNEANRRFADLAANVPGVIVRYITHSDGCSEVEYISPRCIDIWEIKDEEIVHDVSHLWGVIVPEDVPGMQASIQRSAYQLAPWKHRWRIVTVTGRRKWLQGYGRPVRLENGSTLWNSLILDVTSEVAAEDKARENERLLAQAQKQESIGRLAGGVAHDFNNLLAIVMANAEIMLVDDMDGPQEIVLREIVDAAKRGRDLNRSLLSFVQRSDLKPTSIEVNDTIQDLHNLLRRALPEKIFLEVSLMEGLWQIRADRSQLENALLNLVLNARDAMPNGGTVTIESTNVRIAKDCPEAGLGDISFGRYVMIAVSDTGRGIAPDLLGKIFEPFVTTKGPDQGSGLGLATVQGFAKQSGGTVRIYSEVGHGTSVKIFLPAQQDRAALPLPPEQRVVSAATGRILLVEDNDVVRRSIRRILEADGYGVIEARSGDAAFTLLDLADMSFDIVLTDVVMPGRLQGPELVHRIRNRWPEMPAIFMSGYPHEANIYVNGIRDSDISLMKPVARLDLLMSIANLLTASRSTKGSR